MDVHEMYMSRCLQLARHALGRAAPNPMVGAVLVHEGRIIGEGYHKQCGGPHAEIECLDAVAAEDKKLIPSSTLYVSLEPCSHHGRTPPCTQRILQEGIRSVYIGCRDPFYLVDGKGIAQLIGEGVDVHTGILQRESEDLLGRFLIYHTRKRPYIILKWAETSDGKIAGKDGVRVKISSNPTQRLVHLWRSQETAIFAGSGTVMNDNPLLTCRLPGGRHPIRVVCDRYLKLPKHLHIFNSDAPTIILNTCKEEEQGNIRYVKLPDEKNLLPSILAALYDLQIQSMMVEGGAQWLDHFLQAGLWDEVRRLTSQQKQMPEGLPGPSTPWRGKSKKKFLSGTDTIEIFTQDS